VAQRPPTIEELRQDAARVLAFLKALSAALPESVDDGLLRLLGSLADTPGVCELLHRELTRDKT
jgi:hypothetical protein